MKIEETTTTIDRIIRSQREVLRSPLRRTKRGISRNNHFLALSTQDNEGSRGHTLPPVGISFRERFRLNLDCALTARHQKINTDRRNTEDLFSSCSMFQVIFDFWEDKTSCSSSRMISNVLWGTRSAVTPDGLISMMWSHSKKHSSSSSNQQGRNSNLCNSIQLLNEWWWWCCDWIDRLVVIDVESKKKKTKHSFTFSFLAVNRLTFRTSQRDHSTCPTQTDFQYFGNSSFEIHRLKFKLWTLLSW